MRIVLALIALLSCMLPAAAQNLPQPLNDCSGSITTGGTSQQVLAANTNRQYLFIENPSATVSGVSAESLFVNAGAAAAADGKSIEMANLGTPQTWNRPGMVPTAAINIIAATTGHKFVCKWN